MKSKLVGFLVCMMLITTFLTTAINVENTDLKKLTQTEIVTTSFDDDVPIWKVGHKWIYKIKDINIDLEENGSKAEQNKSFQVHLEIDELPLEVVDDTIDYDVEFKANLKGNYSVFIEEDNSTIDIEGKLIGTTIKGNIFFNKSNLGIKKVDYKISGILTVKIKELPDDWNIPKILAAIPLPATITTTIDFDVPYTLLKFPLNASGYRWGLHGTNFTVNGKVQSIWLTILKFINDIATILDYPLLPEDIAALLPVIDIKEALETRGMDNTFEIPEVPSIFSCYSMDNITVPAGNFSAYNISVAEILGKIYYAPTAENIIKIAGQLGDLLPFMTSLEMELVEYELV
ncbi:MAG: hypothetical protein JSW60_00620 [Thermoplasmatales archaeon]|nr:MAG: hypothetical protein JSW60_00620 [Thermoplasmatales archaeon]